MKPAHAVRVFVLAATLLPAVLPAHAQEGMSKVRGDYLIPTSGFDLSQPDDRRAILQNVRTAARRICISEQTPNVLRRTCERQIVTTTIANAPPAVQKALKLAETETRAIQQAIR
jgi:UrcA family protein